MRLIAILLLVLCSDATAQQPRSTANAVAQAIEDNYYDAGRGVEIAAELRAATARGDFDRFEAPLDLATALSTKLAPLDGHFTVRWSPASNDAALSPARRRPPPTRDHGVRAVRILPGNIGYIDLAFFAGFDFSDKRAPARVAIDAALALLQWSDAVIIDVRNNGGGSPAMVGYLTSAFTPKGADIYNTFISRAGTRSEAPLDWHPAPRLEVPLYVLTSGRTGSAAEALAYTLKNAKRAIVVGERSGGAANPGGPVDVGNGFSVFVSDGSPISPITKRNWEHDGVQPTIDVPAHDALRAAQIHALETQLQRSTREDPMTEVRWALEALQAPAELDGNLAPYAGSYGDIRITVEGEALVLQQGRRPPKTLHALAHGEFFVEDEPHRRVAFEKDADGKVIALELRFADGNRSRFQRSDASTGSFIEPAAPSRSSLAKSPGPT
jgi:hypothetical protein